MPHRQREASHASVVEMMGDHYAEIPYKIGNDLIVTASIAAVPRNDVESSPLAADPAWKAIGFGETVVFLRLSR